MKKVLETAKTILWDIPVGLAVAPVVLPAIHVAKAIMRVSIIKTVIANETSNNETEEEK